MRCPSETPEAAELMLARRSRQLDAQSAAALEEHIRSCPACGELLAAQNAVVEALDLWEAPPVSPDFDRRLYRRIEQEVPWWDFLVRPFRPALPARILPLAAAAALMVALGIWVERPAQAPAPPPESAQIEALPPDQAEDALQEMEIMQEFSRLVHSDSAEPRM